MVTSPLSASLISCLRMVVPFILTSETAADFVVAPSRTFRFPRTGLGKAVTSMSSKNSSIARGSLVKLNFAVLA